MDKWFIQPRLNISNRIIRELKHKNHDIVSIAFLSNYKSECGSRYKINLAIATSNNDSVIHQTSTIIYIPSHYRYYMTDINEYTTFSKKDKTVHWKGDVC